MKQDKNKKLMLMATAIVSKPSKWFSNKKFAFGFPRVSRSPTLASSSSPGPSIQDDKLLQVFNHFDRDGDGKISSDELIAYFASTGESLTHVEAQKVISEFDSNGDDLLEFGEFSKLMVQDGHELDDVLRKAFEMFEVDKGSGTITSKGLQVMLRRLGDLKSLQQCADMIKAFDVDGNGVLDFDEFHRMMTQKTCH